MSNDLKSDDEIAVHVANMKRLREALDAARKRNIVRHRRLETVLDGGILVCEFDPGAKSHTRRVRRIYGHFDYDEVDEAIELLNSF